MQRQVTDQYPCDKTPLAIARRTVEQWDDHDKFRAIPEEGSKEPSGVVVARHYMRLYGLLEQSESWIAASVKDGTIPDEHDQNAAIEFGVKIKETLSCVR